MLDPTAVAALLPAVAADALDEALAAMPEAAAAVLRRGGVTPAFAADALTLPGRT